MKNSLKPDVIEALAWETGFCKRKSKLKPCLFFESLMFAHHSGKSLSLNDLCADLMQEHGVGISKQAMDDRFNDRAVLFLQRILDWLLSAELKAVNGLMGLPSRFNRVRLKDSTKFPLPKAFAPKYRGTGGGGNGGSSDNCESLISIQYEYDLISGETLDLRLTDGLKNDQSDSRDFTCDIRKGDLFIRDLGYSTLPYLEKISEKGAFFLNRLPAKTLVYSADNTSKPLDFMSLSEKVRKHGLSHLELDVFVGKQAMLPCRLIVTPVDEPAYERRIRKATETAKSHGHKVSKEYRAKSRLNIFITNVGETELAAEKIREVYTLRWQVELVFKVWKSQARINEIREMKMERFECQLLSKLIWLLLNWRIFKWVSNEMYMRSRLLCSVWKFYKYATQVSQKVRMAFKDVSLMQEILLRALEIAPRQFKLEKKKNKLSQYQTFIHLT